MDVNKLIDAFNTQFTEFISTIQQAFPEDVDILTVQNVFNRFKVNYPKVIANYWYYNIYLLYNTEIENGNIDFFLNKDYSYDLTKNKHSQKIMEAINRVREPFRLMTNDVLKKMIKYIQKLSKISVLIFTKEPSKPITNLIK